MKRHYPLIFTEIILLSVFLVFLLIPVSARAHDAGGSVVLQFPVDAHGGVVEILKWESGQDVMDLEDAGCIKTAEKEAVALQKSSVLDGRVEFENLDPGIYLLRQLIPCDGYEKMDPFLVSLLNSQETKVDAEPKMLPISPESADKHRNSLPIHKKRSGKAATGRMTYSWIWSTLLILSAALLIAGRFRSGKRKHPDKRHN